MCCERVASRKKETTWLRTLRGWKIWTRQKSTLKEVVMPKKGEEIVPFADGSVELARRDQVVRKSTSIQVQNARGEEHNGVDTVQ